MLRINKNKKTFEYIDRSGDHPLMMRAPRHRRASWLREIGESKIDMGLIAPMSPGALDMSLYTAVAEDDHRAVRNCIGANPDMPADGKLGEPSGTLLHFAARHASLKTVIALLNLGADPFAVDEDGKTARQAADDRPTGNRVRTVLALWEKKKLNGDTSPLLEGEEDFSILDRHAAS